MPTENYLHLQDIKSLHPLDIVHTSPGKALLELNRFFFDEDYEKARHWAKIALSSTDMAYDDADARLALINFIDDFLSFIKLALDTIGSALECYCAEAGVAPTSLMAGSLDLSEDASETVGAALIKELQALAPVKDFAAAYPENYVASELWDLLEAVVCYKREHKIKDANIIFFFRTLMAFALLPFRITSTGNTTEDETEKT